MDFLGMLERLGRGTGRHVDTSLLEAAADNPYVRAAGLGAAGGATGSLVGQALGFLDKPRQALYSALPGFHDETGNPLTGSQVAGNVIGSDPDSLGGHLAGIGIDTALDPLTWLAGPLGAVAGRRAGLAAGRVGAANRAAAVAGEAVPGLEAAARAAESVPVRDYAKVAVGGREYPTEAVRAALTGERPAALRGLGGLGGMGTQIRTPPSRFLTDLLERQGYGLQTLGPEGELTGRTLLAGDPETRSLFSTAGGRLRQTGEITPEMRGPFAPLVEAQPAEAALGSVVSPEDLDRLGRQSPLLDALMQQQGLTQIGLPDLPARKAADLFRQAAAETQGGLEGIRGRIQARPLERFVARRLTRNPLGV